MKLKVSQMLYLWLLFGVGLVALIAYLRILFFYNNGHINVSSAPLVLLVLSLPLLASGIYGLVKQRSFTKQPLVLRSTAITVIGVFIIIVLFLILAMYTLGQAFQGSGAFQ
jgi:ABC-type multidrug transport system permease subunit